MAETGQVRITVKWPPRSDVDTQLIPSRSESIKLDISIDGVSVAIGVIPRPSGPPWTSEKTFGSVRASDDALVTATAHPNEDGTGVAQAAAETHITIPTRDLAYPVGGAPGDPIVLRLGSTISSVEVTTDPAVIWIDQTAQLTATAKNATGDTVLVPTQAPFDWSVDSGSESLATVDADGLVTGVVAGDATIRATEVESGVSGTVVVTVTDENRPPVIDSLDCSDPNPPGCTNGNSDAHLHRKRSRWRRNHVRLVGDGRRCRGRRARS